MRDLNPQEHFEAARKAGLKEYTIRVSSGQIGYLPSLEGLLKDVEIVSHVDLGLIEIPLKKIAGTYSHLRSLCFAANFMPILGEDTEFKSKWKSLCTSHLKEGIRDPIKVYEYLNWFYVIEGNKRVSILKYFDAYSIYAHVTRLIPKMDNSDRVIQIYYEFLKFNKLTKINSIWFSRRKSFDRLLKLLEDYNPLPQSSEDKYRYFEIYIYNTFRRVYLELGSGKLPLTTGDAFLEYAKLYGIPDKFDEESLRKTIRELMKELEYFRNDDAIDIKTFPDEGIQQGGIISALSTLILPPKKLKIAFVYARSAETSGWTYSHELGRQYLEETLKNQVTTTYIDNVPEDKESYGIIKSIAADCDIVFTTSPIFRNATLKCAIDYPNVKFFNCSEHRPYKHLSNYFGRTYEPRYLTGIIAGSMTKTNIIGYAATSPTPEVISCINAFALGAKLVNPYAKIKVEWTKEWNSHEKFTDADEKLIKAGADIISNRNLTVPRDVTQKYGVYSMLCSIDPDSGKPLHYLSAPVWHWGIFYEKIVKDILNDTYKTLNDIFTNNIKLVNFWWGMASGVLDIYYSKNHVPPETQKLIILMKTLISNNAYHPFTGPVYDNKGNLKIESDATSSYDDILKMDWFVDNVQAETYVR
jgi:Uncharacterized ABC-type transport system, periplasmic component/surface lipoprotein